MLHISLVCESHLRCSSRVSPRYFIFVSLLIMVFSTSIVSGKLFMVFLFDLKIIKDVLPTFKVSLFAVNQFFTFLMIFLAFSIN